MTDRPVATLLGVLVQPAAAAQDPRAPSWQQVVSKVAALSGVGRALQQATGDLDWLNCQQVALCQVPAPTFYERSRAQHMVRVFAALGHGPSIDPVGNVVVPVVHATQLAYVAVTAHLDTILAPSAAGDIQVEPDGTLTGPGVADNGPGLATLVGLAKLLTKPLVDSPQRNVLLVANVAEEGEGNLHGIRYLVEDSIYSDRIDRYLVLDGASVGHITDAALGSKRFELVIKGPGGHSWNDFGMPHPVHALAGAVARLTGIYLPSQPKTTLSVGTIQGGTSVNSIPASASAKVDVRSTDPCQIRRVARALEQAARTAVASENEKGKADRLSCELREIGNRPAAPPLPDNPVSDCLEAVDSYLQIDSVRDCGSTDANIPMAAHIPAVAIGCGGRGGNIHAPDEWYDPKGRDLGLHRVLLALAGLQVQA